jgi:hypothetical protein
MGAKAALGTCPKALLNRRQMPAKKSTDFFIVEELLLLT